jgi:hypothetical protein
MKKMRAVLEWSNPIILVEIEAAQSARNYKSSGIALSRYIIDRMKEKELAKLKREG